VVGSVVLYSFSARMPGTNIGQSVRPRIERISKPKGY